MASMNLSLNGELTKIKIYPGPVEGTIDLHVGGDILTVEQSCPLKDIIKDLENFLQSKTFQKPIHNSSVLPI